MRARAAALGVILAGCGRGELRVGSKAFTEAVILGEVASQACGGAGARVAHRRQLGGTAVLWRALRTGAIDAYAEYTGTLAAESLRGVDARDLAGLRRRLGALDLAMTDPLGFENTYALGMPEGVARAAGVSTISDLRAHPSWAFALSHEFLQRADGWPGLSRAYGLSAASPRGMDHDLAYRALTARAAQVTDLYSTDAEITSFGLRVLRDDRGYFPDYRAVILYRRDLARRAPACARALDALAGRLDADTMVRMNHAVRVRRLRESHVAAEFLAARGVTPARPATDGRARRVLGRTAEHLAMVLSALVAALLVGVPLGVFAARYARPGAALLGVAGVLQTVPSLALLVLLIPALGIGAGPAIAALVLYALLPIVQGTVTGLRGVAPSLRESAEALGLSPRTRLLRVELPLALPAMLAGARVAAVTSVGTATLGALVGAGGYGQPILTGVRLDDTATILEGAVPAALLALLLQAALSRVERRFIPRGLRAA